MDNPDKLATLGTQDIGQRQTQNTTQKTSKKSKTDTPETTEGELMLSRRLNRSAASYKTRVVRLDY